MMHGLVHKISAAQTRILRQQLLRPDTAPEKLIYPGDEDIDTLHVGAFAGGEHVGIATVMRQPPNVSVGVPAIHPEPDSPDAWRLRGMATTDNARGMGFGAGMLNTCIGYAAKEGGAFVWCDARIHAIGFYERFNFEIMGDQYTVPNAGVHVFMQRSLSPDDVSLMDKYRI